MTVFCRSHQTPTQHPPNTPNTHPTHPHPPAPPGRLTLVAPRVPEDLAIWSGPLPTIDEAAAAAGADGAIYLEDLPAHLASLRPPCAPAPLLHVLDQRAAEGLAAAGVGAGEGARVTADFLPQALARSRARKTMAEVRLL